MKSKWKKGFVNFWAVEIAIEYKACLYFFAMLAFYCIRLMLMGNFQASVWHMCEMIFSAYFMVYFQVYCLRNFDEAERLGGREWIYILLCTVIYTGLSYLFGWFDRSILVTLIFFAFTGFEYWCAYLVNKIKRKADTENLNDMLEKYKKTGNFMSATPYLMCCKSETEEKGETDE